MKIQSHLFLLTVGAVAPLVAVLAGGGVMLWKAEREALVREAIGRTRAAMSAIDTELRGSIAALNALATSKNLDAGDIRAFHTEAQRVLATQPQWRNIGLATLAREQLMDAVRPYGEHAPFGGGEGFEDVVRTRAPVIGSLARGTAVSQLSVRVRVPVIVRGELRYVLSAPLDPTSFDALLRAQRLPEGWTIALADRNKRLIARIPPVPAGTGVSPSFGAAIERAPEGWFRGRTLEGAETYTPYVTSEVSGWILGIAMPADIVEAGATRAALVASIGGLVALAIALALAWLIAQRIAEPIAQLARATDDGLEGSLPPPAAIDEIARLNKALTDAARAVSERQRRLETEQAILVEQSGLLRQRTEEAERLMQVIKQDDRRKDEFLAILAHELRNPLAPAMNALEMLRVVPRDSSAAASAREILDRQMRQMKRLIDDLVDISRITQGKLVLRREPAELKRIVDDAIDASRPLLSAQAHQLDVDLPQAPVQLDGDPARLTQLLSNLLSNSCKFTPPGGRIRLHAHCDGNDLTMVVSDNGAGIAPDLLPRVFDLFVQGDMSLERSTDGLGIGLSLVQRLAQMHGGSVEAASDGVGKGAEFIVHLPIVVASAAASPQGAVAYAKEEPMTLRILVVDDNRDAAESLATLLRLSGHTVDIANDGLLALRSAEQQRPDVVFMDIGMPKLNGYDAARQIRASPWGKTMALIAISGWSQESDRAKSKAAGFDAHLVKPVEFAALEQILADVSGRLQGAS